MRLLDLGLTLSPCLQLKQQHRHLLLEGREVPKAFDFKAILCSRSSLDTQVLLGLLGWGSQPAEGGGVLRGGGASNLHRDLTITTCAPWDPRALSAAPVASSNRGEGNSIVETSFISHTSIQTISTVPGNSSLDQINLTSNQLEM